MYTSPIALVFIALTLFFVWHFGFRAKKPKVRDETAGA